MNPQEALWIVYAGVIFLLWLLLGYFIESRKRRLIEPFLLHNRLQPMAPSPGRRAWQWFFRALALLFMGLALSEPRWGVEVIDMKQTGRDLVFILDVSRSMLAEDVSPSRLKRARLDILDSLSSDLSHRLGLIVFAGKPKELCPLTFDHNHFRKRLKDAGPHSVSMGGTNIGDALQMAMDMIDSGSNLGNAQDFILITDGQDLEDVYEQAAKEANNKKISIYTVGIGNESESTIPDKKGGRLTHDGKVVTTALNPMPLKLISSYSAGGIYQNMSQSPDWMKRILADIDKKEQVTRDQRQQERAIPRAHYFLLPAMFFWGLALAIRDRREKKRRET